MKYQFRAKYVITAVLIYFFIEASAQITVDKNLLIEDFEFICEKLENVHPNIYAHISEQDYKTQKRNILDNLEKVGNQPVEDFYLLVAPFVASLKDGHTSVYTVFSPNRADFLKAGGLTYPLKIRTANGYIIADEIFTDDNQGVNKNDTILSINGVSSDSICAFLYNLEAAENNRLKDKVLDRYLSVLLWYKYHFENFYTYGIKKGNSIELIEIKGLPSSEAESKMAAALQQNIAPYELFFEDADNATLRIKNFGNAVALSDFLNDAFRQIREKQIETLTIDIRDNGGGTSYAVDSLVFHLTKQPYNLYEKSYAKISQELKDHYEEKYPERYGYIKDVPVGEIITRKFEPVISNKEYIFEENLRVLCDETTYSGALSFLSLVECLKLGEIIGNRIDNNKRYFGNMLVFETPNTGMWFYVSREEFFDCGAEALTKNAYSD